MNLSADLGHLLPLYQEETQSSSHVKPSRLRRRKRRQRERAKAKELNDAHDDELKTGDICDEVDSKMEDGLSLLDDSQSLSDQTPTMANLLELNIQREKVLKPTISSSCNVNLDSKCWDELSLTSKSMSSSTALSSSISGTLNGIKPPHRPTLHSTSFQR